MEFDTIDEFNLLLLASDELRRRIKGQQKFLLEHPDESYVEVLIETWSNQADEIRDRLLELNRAAHKATSA